MTNTLALRSYPQNSAFTLIELIVVITIIAVISAVVAIRGGAVSYWEEEGLIRRLSEIFTFLHSQAVVDQAFYCAEFDLTNNQYTIGVLRPDSDVVENLKELTADAGNLSVELAAFLNPSLGANQTLIPPPSFPSLGKTIKLPESVIIEDIRTRAGKQLGRDGGKVHLIFSPRGFSEFAVVHLRMSNDAPVTILINPFTGGTEIYREYKDFEWSYGRDKDKQT